MEHIKRSAKGAANLKTKELLFTERTMGTRSAGAGVGADVHSCSVRVKSDWREERREETGVREGAFASLRCSLRHADAGRRDEQRTRIGSPIKAAAVPSQLR